MHRALAAALLLAVVAAGPAVAGPRAPLVVDGGTAVSNGLTLVAVDPTDGTAYAAFTQDGAIGIARIGADGALRPGPTTIPQPTSATLAPDRLAAGGGTAVLGVRTATRPAVVTVAPDGAAGPVRELDSSLPEQPVVVAATAAGGGLAAWRTSSELRIRPFGPGGVPSGTVTITDVLVRPTVAVGPSGAGLLAGEVPGGAQRVARTVSATGVVGAARALGAGVDARAAVDGLGRFAVASAVGGRVVVQRLDASATPTGAATDVAAAGVEGLGLAGRPGGGFWLTYDVPSDGQVVVGIDGATAEVEGPPVTWIPSAIRGDVAATPEGLPVVAAGAGIPRQTLVATSGATAALDAVAFGEVTAGASATREATVRNPGPTRLVVRAASVTGTALTVARDGCSGTTVPVGGACTIELRYAPTTPGTLAGTLAIDHDGDVASVRSAAVGGTAVAAPPITPSPTVVPPAPVPSASRTCLSRRAFVSRALRLPPGARRPRGELRQRGRLVRRIPFRGRRPVVDLRGLRQGTFVVRLTYRTAKGRPAVRSRTYRTCTPR